SGVERFAILFLTMFFFYLIDTLVPMGWGANLTSLGFSRHVTGSQALPAKAVTLNALLRWM
ncbi:MAG TPA: hypothetical protein VI479_00185, partial [Blastocatellia bacterium]